VICFRAADLIRGRGFRERALTTAAIGYVVDGLVFKSMESPPQRRWKLTSST
jgi:hypothetical protein